jgi:hypothetical protein
MRLARVSLYSGGMKWIACLALVVACSSSESSPTKAAPATEPPSPVEAACQRGCKHVIECGVAGTYEGCVSECAHNVEAKTYSLDVVAAITTADCGTVKANVRLSSAPPESGDTACSAACRNFAGCQIQPFDACMKECAGISPDRLAMYAGASCEQLRSGDFGSQGYGCLRNGAQDCQVGMMCCFDHRASRPGEQGSCLYAALCYHRGF